MGKAKRQIPVNGIEVVLKFHKFLIYPLLLLAQLFNLVLRLGSILDG